MNPKAHLLVFFILFGLAACGQPQTIPPTQTALLTPQPTATLIPSSTPGISPEALAYLDEVFEIVQEYSINRDKVDWEALKAMVYADEVDAVTPADTYDSVRHILVWLNDHHSIFLSAEDAETFNNLDLSASENQPPEGWISEEGYAYLYLTKFGSGDLEVNEAYANQIQQLVKDLDASAPCAWVIDLREHLGGNLFAMVPGFSGLIPDGELYGSMDVNGEITTDYLINGQYVNTAGEVAVTVYDPLTELQHPSPVIAILVGPYTTSAGEMLALSFKGLPNVTYFGHETNGQTTDNSLFTLSDGAIILLTTGTFVDRTGQVYGGSFMPDIPLSGIYEYPHTIPPIVLDWLAEQDTCQQ